MDEFQERRILETIYESRSSIIYRAVRGSEQMPVILKMLREDHPAPECIVKYKQEYRIERSLKSLPGVILVYGLDKHGNGLVLELEDFGGKSLNLLMISNHFTLEERLVIAIKIVDALGNIHSANVIHKDINPSNIVFNPTSGELKIIDFGIATVLAQEVPVLTVPKTLEGSLTYMSPEQTGRMNRSVDYRSDYYSLGVTLYELFTGRLPCESSDPLELVHFHVARNPISPKEVNSELPESVSNIVLKLMAKNAEERYQSALGLKADLELCLKLVRTNRSNDTFRLGVSDIPEKFVISPQLYGRDYEMDGLISIFDRVAAGSKEIAVVCGEAGIGKTSLVRQLYKPITSKRGYFLSGKFDQLHRNILRGIVAPFREQINQLLSESADSLKQWREKMLAALGPNCQVMIDVIPEVELIVGPQSPVPDLEPIEALNRFRLVFQDFIRVFCSRGHPLVIFLDDVQWADSSSLELLELIMANPETRYLLLIVSFRDEEVNVHHPVIITLESLRRENLSANVLRLERLQPKHVVELISATLHKDPLKVTELAELVYQKTAGNPFFLKEFLKSLYEEGFIQFNDEAGGWIWAIAQIQQSEITDNVADLMANRIQKLPPLTQELLKLGACFGNQFGAHALAWSVDKSLKSVVEGLTPAVTEGLAFPVGPHYKWIELEVPDESPAMKIEYRFGHDRIQNAAYSLIPDNERPSLHRKVGLTILENVSKAHSENVIFEIVDQLNKGFELIADDVEKLELAEMNLRAGRRVKSSSAYEAAFMYFQAGLKVLVKDGWSKHYDVTLNLHLETIETAYLTAKFDEMEKFSSVVMEKAKHLLDRLKVYEVQIQAAIALNSRVNAVKIALPILALLGERFPDNPSSLNVLTDFFKTRAVLFRHESTEITGLREMSDQLKLAAMRIMSSVVSAAYTVTPNLFPMVMFRMVRLSVKHGIAPQSVLAFGGYGIILCAKIGDIETARKFGDLALNLIKRHEFWEYHARTIFIVNSFIKIRSEPLRDGLKPLKDAYRIGLEVGDIEYAALSGAFYCTQGYAAGKELVELEKDLDLYATAIGKLKQRTTELIAKLYHQSVLNLMEGSENVCKLVGRAYNEEEILPSMFKLNERSIILATFVHKLILCYLFREYRQAIENSQIVEKYLDGAQGTVLIPLAMFYGSLARLAVFSESDQNEQDAILKKVATNQKVLGKWSDTAPMNYLNKFYLVEAERSRVLKDYHKAADDYDTSISLARENEFTNEEAVALERASDFYLSIGKTIVARAYMQEARYSYFRWGALAKVRHLEDSYPDLLVGGYSSVVGKSTSLNGSSAAVSEGSLDLSAVLKASQVLSGEIVLSELLRKLMKLVLEIAGAERGCLILVKEDSLFVEVRTSVGDVDKFEPASVGIEDCNEVSVALVNYVARTKEPVILNDAKNDEMFIQDKYLKKICPSSVICVPVMRSGQLFAILYMENNQTIGAFTPDRVEMLKVLSSHAAISIQNAILYKTAEESATRYRSLFENAQEAIFIVQDGLIKFSNPKTSEMTGYSSHELSSLNFTDLIHDADQAHIFDQNTGDLKERVHSNVYSFRIVRKDASSLWGQINSVSVNWEDRPATLNFLTDITELKRAADLHIRTERLKAIAELASGVAHNFNNLLQVIMAGVELALTNLEAGDTRTLKNYLEQIRESSKFGSETVRRLQSFAKIRADGVSSENTRFDLSQLVKQASEISRPWWKTNLERDRIHIDMESNLTKGCFVSGKESEIFEVLINLIKNAAEAMPEGGLIKAKTFVVDDQVVFEIEDSGTGISDENMKRIFEPFWSTKGDMGTGMGLSVTHGILSSHGGEIAVASKVGEGTKFTIKLPLAEAGLKLSPSETSTVLDSQLRILVVDDIAPLRTLLHDLFICHGHTILMAESGIQALDLFRNNEFDLVICDLGMPEMTGWEVGGSIKKICLEKQIPKTPFLMLTGWGGQSLGTEMMEESGIDGIIEKPVDIAKLFEMIRKVVYA